MTIDREKRENVVLEAIVKAHVNSAVPVGSKTIARILGLSSATIRNVMFQLEKKEYIRQPYTSAGRVPTDLGYRRYVNNMESIDDLPGGALIARIRRYLREKRLFEEVIEATSHAISEITNYTGIALSPTNKLYFDGAYHMLEQPEFRELDMVRDFMKIVEERSDLARIMNKDLEIRGTVIRIGRENLFDGLRECTIITSVYKFKNRVSGNIGVIGPMRMEYDKIVPIVEYFASMTTEILEEI
ncbi:MAG: hypothetical protein ABID09_05165 [Candidatus Omnitrophota bacterium]